jgi:hypothetical protein
MMVNNQEISEIRNIIKHNDECPDTAVIYEYQDWHSADGQSFSKVDETGHVIEVDQDNVNNLGMIYWLDEWLNEEGDYDEKMSALLETEV